MVRSSGQDLKTLILLALIFKTVKQAEGEFQQEVRRSLSRLAQRMSWA